jgi:hypothetical protein
MKTPQVAAIPGTTPLGIKPQPAKHYDTATPAEMKQVKAIAEAAVAVYERLGIKVRVSHVMAQLLLCHENVAPLDLQRMLDNATSTAGGGQYMHDVTGIERHLVVDGTKVTLTDCFWPRYAKPSRDR